jgi:hypothetical protein
MQEEDGGMLTWFPSSEWNDLGGAVHLPAAQEPRVRSNCERAMWEVRAPSAPHQPCPVSGTGEVDGTTVDGTPQLPLQLQFQGRQFNILRRNAAALDVKPVTCAAGSMTTSRNGFAGAVRVMCPMQEKLKCPVTSFPDELKRRISERCGS